MIVVGSWPNDLFDTKEADGLPPGRASSRRSVTCTFCCRWQTAIGTSGNQGTVGTGNRGKRSNARGTREFSGRDSSAAAAPIACDTARVRSVDVIAGGHEYAPW